MSTDLHALMMAHRSATADLDREWRVHLMVVPARLGCGRGVMYDQIAVPREGCASFSDDGYPHTESASFGVAADNRQRDVPRAFLRSATHEITHTFNQIHQELETTADNSIMTTTPSVATVLGGPATGDPGVFPDQINLAVNTTVRHHLNHMPDPVIRPGGWPFGAWFGNSVPQAGDRFAFDDSELELQVAVNWSARGVPVGVGAEHELFVDFPTTAADNRAAALVLNAEVGKWVALGGDAYHLPEATRRLGDLAAMGGEGDQVLPSLLAGFDGLLPDPDRTP